MNLQSNFHKIFNNYLYCSVRLWMVVYKRWCASVNFMSRRAITFSAVVKNLLRETSPKPALVTLRRKMAQNCVEILYRGCLRLRRWLLRY